VSEGALVSEGLAGEGGSRHDLNIGA
jgi:hypothetical protein